MSVEDFNFYKDKETQEIFVAYLNPKKNCYVVWGKGRKECIALSADFFREHFIFAERKKG